jgi:hypothetical protein
MKWFARRRRVIVRRFDYSSQWLIMDAQSRAPLTNSTYSTAGDAVSDAERRGWKATVKARGCC